MEATTDAITVDQGLQHRHVIPDFGLPYGEAGVRTFTSGPKPFSRSTVTCPVCGFVAMGRGPKQAGADYASHFTQRADAEAKVAAGQAFAIRLTRPSQHQMPGEPLITDYEAGTVLLAVGEDHHPKFGHAYLVPWFDGTTRAVGFDHAERVA